MFLIIIALFAVMVSSIAGGCLDPEAFDYSIYMEMERQEPATYHHTITQQDARYKQSKAALDRVVDKTKSVDWEEQEAMEIVSRELEFEAGADEESVEFEPEKEVEFEVASAGRRGQAPVAAEVEFEGGEEEEEVQFDLEEPASKPSKDQEISIKDIDGSEAHTVKDYEADEQKKEMPKEEFKI